MKLLAIDIGNTSMKYAVQEDGRWHQAGNIDSAALTKHHILFSDLNYDSFVISNVSEDYPELIDQLLSNGHKGMMLSNTTILPFENHYKTPATLGRDRIAAVAGALKLYPKENILIVDSGTCTKYDFLSQEGHYYGGAIAPGLQMKLDAMHHFTARLPSYKVEDTQQWLGRNTEESLKSGALMASIFECEGYIKHFEEKFGQLRVILTGGRADFFAKNLKTKIFVHPELILEGLAHLYKTNEI